MILLTLLLSAAAGPELVTQVSGGFHYGSLYHGGHSHGGFGWSPPWQGSFGWGGYGGYSGFSPVYWHPGPGPWAGFGLNGTDAGAGAAAGAGAGAAAGAAGDPPAADEIKTEEDSAEEISSRTDSSEEKSSKEAKRKRKSSKKLKKRRNRDEDIEDSPSLKRKVLVIPDFTPFPDEKKKDTVAVHQFFQTLAIFDNGTCFEKLFCNIHAKTDGNMTTYEKNVVSMFKLLNSDDLKGQPENLVTLKYLRAAEYGKQKQNARKCGQKYSDCLYSTNDIINMNDMVKKSKK